jgi:hypothetical protein
MQAKFGRIDVWLGFHGSRVYYQKTVFFSK